MKILSGIPLSYQAVRKRLAAFTQSFLKEKTAARTPNEPVRTYVLPNPTPGQGWRLCRYKQHLFEPENVQPDAAPSRHINTTNKYFIAEDTFPSLEAVAAALELGEPFVLGLPIEMGLFQRLQFPKVPHDELKEMTRLQFEKVLHYAPEDIGIGYQIIKETETDIDLLAQAVQYEQLLALTQPLTSAGCWPQQVTFECFIRAASVTAQDPHALLFYHEFGRVIAGITENRHLSFVQALHVDSEEIYKQENEAALENELSMFLLNAEMESAAADHFVAYLASSCTQWVPALEKKEAAMRIESLPLLPTISAALPKDDFSPPQWESERQRVARIAARRKQILIGILIYFLFVFLAIIDLTQLKIRIGFLQKRINATTPQVAQIENSIKRWKSLAPAIETRLTIVEILDQIRQALPSAEDTRLTLFELNRTRSPAILTIEGESSSVDQAVDLTEKIKNKPELKDFHFTAEPPVILPNGRAHFRLTAKLPT